MIAISDLTKSYGDVAVLRGLTLTIGPGMFGLLGPNGAGKTTLLRILAGILSPTGGRVEIFGHDLADARGRQQARARLGYLPQELGLYPDLTGRELLDYIAVLKGVGDRRARRRQIDGLLDALHLLPAADRRIKAYSGGMKRRLGVAQALLGEPRLLIVDEPTVGLDPEERVRLRNLLAEAARRCTVILSTHIVEDIGQSCDDMAVLGDGLVRFRGSPQELAELARGQVWTLMGADEPSDKGLVLVASQRSQAGAQYRVLGQPAPGSGAIPATPSLEDGYMWLMRRRARS